MPLHFTHAYDIRGRVCRSLSFPVFIFCVCYLVLFFALLHRMHRFFCIFSWLFCCFVVLFSPYSQNAALRQQFQVLRSVLEAGLGHYKDDSPARRWQSRLTVTSLWQWLIFELISNKKSNTTGTAVLRLCMCACVFVCLWFLDHNNIHSFDSSLFMFKCLYSTAGSSRRSGLPINGTVYPGIMWIWWENPTYSREGIEGNFRENTEDSEIPFFHVTQRDKLGKIKWPLPKIRLFSRGCNKIIDPSEQRKTQQAKGSKNAIKAKRTRIARRNGFMIGAVVSLFPVCPRYVCVVLSPFLSLSLFLLLCVCFFFSSGLYRVLSSIPPTEYWVFLLLLFLFCSSELLEMRTRVMKLRTRSSTGSAKEGVDLGSAAAAAATAAGGGSPRNARQVCVRACARARACSVLSSLYERF